MKRVPVERTHEVRFGRLSIAIDDVKAEVQNRARELAKLAEKVEFLKGTEVEV